MENAFSVPLFIEAVTKEELIKKMVENNAKNKIRYKYFAIVNDGKTWTGWYEGDARTMFTTILPTAIPNETNVKVNANGRTKKVN